MKTDILAFGAHPDDVELGCAGTILKHIDWGYTAGVVDLTRGELGTRGNVQIRERETKEASIIMRVAFRKNLGFADGFFVNDKQHQTEVVKIIRKYQPEIVIANALTDRHPDHGKAAQLVAESCFLAGLVKIETFYDNIGQAPWRPKMLYHYIQDRYIIPDFVVDISGYMDKKMEAVGAYKSQFFNPHSTEPDTYISSSRFTDTVRNRAADFGRTIRTDYAEGFTSSRIIGVKNIFALI